MSTSENHLVICSQLKNKKGTIIVWFTKSSSKISKLIVTYKFVTNRYIEESDKLLSLRLNIITEDI